MISTIQSEIRDILTTNILPYWMNKMVDEENGGFYGRITGTEQLVPQAEKGGILNSRILWTFSAAYRVLGKEEYLAIARRAKDYIIAHFYDKEFGGTYWSLDYKGQPSDTKKQIYAIGFTIYGLSEYYRVTNDQEALTYAIRLFESIEKHSFDTLKDGYYEAFARDWTNMTDVRLSEKDANEKKTMNTHLHVLEAYTNLYRVWKDACLKKQLHNLILIFTDKILNRSTGHLGLFFDDDWKRKQNIVSYGHDIEASWLIHEAAMELGNGELLNYIEPLVKQMARAATEGYAPGRGMIYEKNPDTGHTDGDRHWWVQAEAVVGYTNLYRHFADEEALDKAADCWNFIKAHIIDHVHGEWHWSLRTDGAVNIIDDKAGFWKCPYHNGRMCLEIIK